MLVLPCPAPLQCTATGHTTAVCATYTTNTCTCETCQENFSMSGGACFGSEWRVACLLELCALLKVLSTAVGRQGKCEPDLLPVRLPASLAGTTERQPRSGASELCRPTPPHPQHHPPHRPAQGPRYQRCRRRQDRCVGHLGRGAHCHLLHSRPNPRHCARHGCEGHRADLQHASGEGILEAGGHRQQRVWSQPARNHRRTDHRRA